MSGSREGNLVTEARLLAQVAAPDVQVLHRPAACSVCQCPLDEVAGQVVERRQVQDLPPLKRLVTEHQVEAVCCPRCQQVTQGTFPPEVRAPAQYGPHLRALAVYLNQYQLVPEARTCEALMDLLDCSLSDGTVAGWVQEAAERLSPTVEQIADLVVASRVQHADETGVRIGGQLQWLHVNSTRWLTHLAGIPNGDNRHSLRLVSGRVSRAGPSMTVGPVTIIMAVCIASAKRTSCGI